MKILTFLSASLLFAVFAVPAVAGDEAITVTILYDNTAFAPETQADWGYSCLIEGTEKTILFDAGTKPEVFFHNVEILGVDLHRCQVPRS